WSEPVAEEEVSLTDITAPTPSAGWEEPAVDVDAELDATPALDVEEVDSEPVADIELVEELPALPVAAIPPPPAPALSLSAAPSLPVARLTPASPTLKSPAPVAPSAPAVAASANHLRPTDDTLFEVPGPGFTSAASSFVEGEHRVIIHTVEGQVKRGTIRDADLLEDTISLEQQSGFAPERIPGKRVKAIFFMLAAGARQPQAEGSKIRVTFNDGRQVAGFSQDFKGPTPGFFVIPADTRTNTARIFIYRASVQAVAEG
ncbi:hypothetical protein D7Y21_24935, partial [Corallococcus sp. AB045]